MSRRPSSLVLDMPVLPVVPRPLPPTVLPAPELPAEPVGAAPVPAPDLVVPEDPVVVPGLIVPDPLEPPDIVGGEADGLLLPDTPAVAIACWLQAEKSDCDSLSVPAPRASAGIASTAELKRTIAYFIDSPPAKVETTRDGGFKRAAISGRGASPTHGDKHGRGMVASSRLRAGGFSLSVVRSGVTITLRGGLSLELGVRHGEPLAPALPHVHPDGWTEGGDPR
jgi:hypothetical protein